MSRAKIRFAADILRRLGEELNPSPDQGIVELAKNAYDANAKNCYIQLEGTDSTGGKVRIADDGDGMTDEEIVNGWLVLGRSPKDPTKRTRLGRLPAGSKGLGRLAALRMGTTARLATRPRSDSLAENLLSIDWTQFDSVSTVDQVALSLRTQPRKRQEKPGTEITLENLRSKISRGDVKRLARGLVLLADPFGDDPSGFNPTLAAPEYEDLERIVRNRYFEDADFHLVARLDESGRASAKVLDFKGKPLYSAQHPDLTQDRPGRTYQSPPARFDLWVFILSKSAFGMRSTSIGQVREWLSEFGGVHVYQNGVRVAPYGSPGDDWLELNLRRVRSPEERPGTNTSIGRVAIDDKKHVLEQKTDRSGFIETEIFSELRSFAQDASEWMARRRLDEAEKRRAHARSSAPKKVKKARTRVEKAIKKAPAAAREAIETAFGAYDRTRAREATNLRREVQLYRTLSTAGITAVTLAHESTGNPIKIVKQSIATVERRGRNSLGGEYEAKLRNPVERIKKAADALAAVDRATLRLVDHDKRRVGRVDIHRTISSVLDTFRPFLTAQGVTLQIELAPRAPFLRGSEAALESIVTNLLNNSVSAFVAGAVVDRRILVSTTVSDGKVAIAVADSGPGIQGIEVRDIWLPGESTRPNGTGLGLAIVRDTVVDLGGEVFALPNGELGGAQISLELPILGA